MTIRGALRIAAVNGVLMIAGLSAVEVVFGGWLRHDELYRLDPLRDAVLQYDVSGLYATSQPTITYSRDKYGLRGRYGSDPGAITILTVGGSTTDQRYITDGQTWQDALQRRFEQAGRPLGIANAGIDGQSTVGHLDAFDWWFPNIPGLRPRYILFYVGLNDFYIDGDAVAAATAAGPWLKTFENNSAVWHLGRKLWGIYLAEFVFGIGHRRVDFSAASWTREGLQPDYAFAYGRIAAYASRLEALVDRTRRFGAEPIFVTQPSRYYRVVSDDIEGDAEVRTFAGRPINGVDAYRIMRRMDAALEQVSRTRHAHFVDLALSRWDDGDFYDRQHLNPAGIAKLASAMFEALRGIVLRGA